MNNWNKLKDDVEQGIMEVTNDETRPVVRKLVNLIFEKLQQATASGPVIIDNDILLESLLKTLSGQQIASNQAVLSFGEGTQFGDVIFKDIARGNITTINFSINVPPQPYFTNVILNDALGISSDSIESKDGRKNRFAIAHEFGHMRIDNTEYSINIQGKTVKDIKREINNWLDGIDKTHNRHSSKKQARRRRKT